jgi:hypothetical protein
MRRPSCMVLAIALTLSTPAFGVAAQDEDEDGDAIEEGDDETPADEGDSESDEESAEPQEAIAAASDDGPRKFYFGLYGRYNILPSFILRMFLDEAPTVSNPAFGVAMNVWNPSDGGPSFQIGIGYSSYSFDGPFRATGDPAVDTEYLKSSLGLVHVTGSILWNAPIIDDVLTFEYGLGLDFGIVTGDLIRSEARFDSASGSYVPCSSKNDPFDPLHTYCGFPTPPTLDTNGPDEEGEHYNVKANIPPVFAFPLLPHLALRYEPLNGLAFKFETGLFPVFWLGLSAAYAPF